MPNCRLVGEAVRTEPVKEADLGWKNMRMSLDLAPPILSLFVVSVIEQYCSTVHLTQPPSHPLTSALSFPSPRTFARPALCFGFFVLACVFRRDSIFPSFLVSVPCFSTYRCARYPLARITVLQFPSPLSVILD